MALTLCVFLQKRGFTLGLILAHFLACFSEKRDKKINSKAAQKQPKIRFVNHPNVD